MNFVLLQPLPGTSLQTFLIVVDIQPMVGDLAFAIVRRLFRKRFDALMDGATRELCEARDAAEAASRSKSEFLASMSHDIRTPLHSIIGMSDLMLESELQPSQREAVEIVRTSADALLALINDILDFSKIEAGKLLLSPAPFSLRQSLTQLEQMFRLGVEKKDIALVIELKEDVPDALRGDPLRLNQVLMNLLSNAIKFTPDQGGVLIYISLESRNQGVVRLHFDVSDTGIGIDPDAQKVIFDAFAQADPSTTRTFGGTGLGLSISSRIVEMMGGSLTVQSMPGFGSRFDFSAEFEELPSFAGPKPELLEAAKESPAQFRSLRVLLVEDNIVNQKLALRVLERAGHQVLLAKNGFEAVNLYQHNLFDVVLMDVQMPVLDGYAATRAIREIEKKTKMHVPVIAMTAHALEGYREQCLASGMDDYVPKPFDTKQLLVLLQKITATTSVALPS